MLFKNLYNRNVLKISKYRLLVSMEIMKALQTEEGYYYIKQTNNRNIKLYIF